MHAMCIQKKKKTIQVVQKMGHLHNLYLKILTTKFCFPDFT